MIYNTISGAYRVEVHGNGWAYTITCNTTGESVWVQDEDAEQMRRDTNDFEDEISIEQYFGLE